MHRATMINSYATETDETDRPRVTRVRMVIGAIILLFVGLVWAYFLTGELRSFKVISASMVPTLEVGDYVLMRRDAEDMDVKGRVIVFDNPQRPGEALTKRVIAVEGDDVTLRNGFVRVNGEPDDHNSVKIVNVRNAQWTIGTDEFFVLGDNRNDSFDSIDMGPITRSRVQGVVIYRYWPRSRAGKIE